jgi:hypothetical protein
MKKKKKKTRENEKEEVHNLYSRPDERPGVPLPRIVGRDLVRVVEPGVDLGFEDGGCPGGS